MKFSSNHNDKIQLKILAVEDNRNFIMLLQECLTGLKGITVEKNFAQDAKTAMQKFGIVQPDLVLLDIMLPDGSGLDLIRPMLAIRSETKIVMVTGSAVAEDVLTAGKNGAIGYILKPYTKGKIHDAIQAYITYYRQTENASLSKYYDYTKNYESFNLIQQPRS